MPGGGGAATRGNPQRRGVGGGGDGGRPPPSADPITVGYHLSALYSPIGWLSWERIVRALEAAKGSDEAIKAFRNTILGETWVETGEAPDWQRLYDRRERWKSGTVPGGGLFLTAGADVQKDRIEVDVWAWGRGLESWRICSVCRWLTRFKLYFDCGCYAYITAISR